MESFLFLLSPLLICSASSNVSGSGSFSVDGRNLNCLWLCRPELRPPWIITISIALLTCKQLQEQKFHILLQQPMQQNSHQDFPLNQIYPLLFKRISKLLGQRLQKSRKTFWCPFPLTYNCGHAFHSKAISIVPVVVRKHFAKYTQYQDYFFILLFRI